MRGHLVALLRGYPRDAEPSRSYEWTAEAVLAAVDSVLIRAGLQATSCREKLRRFEELSSDERLVGLVRRAFDVKLRRHTPPDLSPAAFWASALRFYLDCLLGLRAPSDVYRSDRLTSLVSTFHYETASRVETVRNLSRVFLLRNRRGRVERFLLAVAVARDLQAPDLDLDLIARQAGVPAGLEWQEFLDHAIGRTDRLSRPRAA